MLLERVNSPADLQKISLHRLPKLAREIRGRIIEVVSANGGHLASSLGAVELIVALHYCLDLCRDRIVFDVGHQAYAHKILTGRNRDFCTLRRHRGLSGFPCREESEFDVFTTGHSSNAVSLALGLACAPGGSSHKDMPKVVAVIGDGSLSGGLCFEGLNNAGHLKKDILVVLNTNEMSIAPNVGAVSTYLNKIISMPIYNRFRESLENFARSRLPKGSRLIKMAAKFEEGLKGLFVPGMLFEELGFRYFGPIDGHDVRLLVSTLKNILSIKGPRLLHVVTRKGKGYVPAEKNPVAFHGTGAFDVSTGKASSCAAPAVKQPSYTSVFSDQLMKRAAEDKDICAITAAMPEGTGLDVFRDAYPERFYDVGIAEGHAVCFAAGLARAGRKPVVAIYSTFLQRAYDQLIEDIALQDAPVVLALDRSGIVGEDGRTHQGIFDLAYLRTVPSLTVMAPKDSAELRAMLDFALDYDHPVALRYPRGAAPAAELGHSPVEFARGELLRKGKDILVVACGSMVLPAMGALDELDKRGVSGALINARFIKPLDAELCRRMSQGVKTVFTVEEGVREGGLGSAVQEDLNCPVVRIGLPSEFIPHGTRSELLKRYGLTAEGIVEEISRWL
ncbi:MAG: 1-deoxy-D-xylulose-5-phosphate synthase [Candidatus Omnitrophica bacterium]|nr:1-deoxy-D-xylulose-5-phosphate synthase [Candidatus Omnitrophota bacterium]